ncbi:MAG: flagellar biosynthetic protein FliR [Motiliproteus sp.]|nr:flagellar biosynthetic protein FliR [Motiliproteus sp.]MCW9052022.1 flagellar biosynthetic protein FliR [Motiliproteus sp.]
MEFAIPDLTQWVTQALLPFFRIAAFFMVVPLIGTQLVPVNIRLGFAIAVTLVIMPSMPSVPAIDGLSLALYVSIAQQLLIGFALGFMVQVFFHVVVLGGQIISYQMGLGFASISDPTNGVSVVVLSQFYLMLTMLLFLSMNGHLVLIEVIVDSFRVIPGYSESIPSISLWRIVISGSWLFAAALLMALPAVIAVLVVNFAFGIMTKAAPQLNIFAIGFPFTMIFGVFITWVSLSGFLGQYQRIATEAMEMITHLLITG